MRSEEVEKERWTNSKGSCKTDQRGKMLSKGENMTDNGNDEPLVDVERECGAVRRPIKVKAEMLSLKRFGHALSGLTVPCFPLVLMSHASLYDSPTRAEMSEGGSKYRDVVIALFKLLAAVVCAAYLGNGTVGEGQNEVECGKESARMLRCHPEQTRNSTPPHIQPHQMLKLLPDISVNGRSYAKAPRAATCGAQNTRPVHLRARKRQVMSPDTALPPKYKTESPHQPSTSAIFINLDRACLSVLPFPVASFPRFGRRDGWRRVVREALVGDLVVGVLDTGDPTVEFGEQGLNCCEEIDAVDLLNSLLLQLVFAVSSSANKIRIQKALPSLVAVDGGRQKT
ncbi:hypothetical protein B0H19DRAFT_1242559 [Mycena capillaripes]|nr:hypothetical protein B0H19DRAFT_1242559 [Mycena capillaripes]